jgi:ABC-type uncharacterized transport system substrate-binding protein
MWLVVKRLSLGVSLLVLASALLLLSDWSRLSASRLPTGGQPGAKRVWEIFLFSYVESPNEEEARRGVAEGLRAGGLTEGRDFKITTHNAQGDMATLNGLADAAVSSSADMVCTLSTPALQAAVRRVRDRPVVFGLVANPIIAGAGKSNTDHLPNFTGAYVIAPFDEMMPVIRECVPKARRVGTLFVPAEVNSVFYKDLFVTSARKAGFEVETMGVNTTAEVPDAAAALCGRGIDVLCQISDNLSSSSFPTIALAAQKAHVPLFAFASAQARQGAAVVLARDYAQAGRDSGLLAAQVLQGRDPARIPFQATEKTRFLINLKAADGFAVQIPENLLKRADEVIGK